MMFQKSYGDGTRCILRNREDVYSSGSRQLVMHVESSILYDSVQVYEFIPHPACLLYTELSLLLTYFMKNPGPKNIFAPNK